MPGGGGYGPQGGKPPADTKPKKDDATASQITLNRNEKTIEFTLDLILDNTTLERVASVATLEASIVRVQIDLANRRLHPELARITKVTGEKGLSDRDVPPNQFPPGAFPAKEGPPRSAHEPQNRVSWMAALLPYMGQDALYSRVSFRHGWRDPNNWLAGKAIVPEFLDPMYPDATRHVNVAGVPVDFGATHFVAIAGVGLDAPTYPRDDPAYIAKRGVFSYDKSATYKDIQEGRGVSNTITLIQVPHDGPAGVTPWIAGGGATIRGVPEKNSIAPFVLSTDKYGKVMTYKDPKDNKERRGTFAMMADGTVRFIDRNISDDVFKALCTIGGGAPEGFEQNKNKFTAPAVFPKEEILPEAPVVQAPVKGADPGQVAWQLPKGWITFTSPDGYSVAMPQQPKTTKQPLPPIGVMTINMVEVPGKKILMLASAIPIPGAELAKINPDEMFKMIAAGMTAKGGNVQNESAIALGPYKGREFLIEYPLDGNVSVPATVRFYLVRDRVMWFMVTGGGALTSEGATFFNSLKIN